MAISFTNWNSMPRGFYRSQESKEKQNLHPASPNGRKRLRNFLFWRTIETCTHGRALLASTPEGRCAYLQADIKDPEYILRHPVTRETLDFGAPVALILTAVLHFFADEEEPGKIVETLVDALPPGSYVVASHGTAEYSPQQRVDGGVRAYQQGGMPLRLRDGDEFADLVFKGLTLVPPGMVVVSDWRPDPGTLPLAAREVGVNGAVARKP